MSTGLSFSVGKTVDALYTLPPQDGLAVTGQVVEPLTLTVAELQLIKNEAMDNVLVACMDGDPKGRINRAKGVLLEDILKMAGGIKTPDHNAPNRTFVVVSGRDGYRTVFSWHEIFNTPVGDGVVVLLEKDGQPIEDDNGPLILVSAMDYLMGGRYVKRLSSIEVVML